MSEARPARISVAIEADYAPSVDLGKRGPGRAGDLVRRGIERHQGDHREPSALAPKDRAPQAIGLAGEDVVWERWLHDPRVLFELRLELSRSPSGVPGEHASPFHVADGFASTAPIRK